MDQDGHSVLAQKLSEWGLPSAVTEGAVEPVAHGHEEPFLTPNARLAFGKLESWTAAIADVMFGPDSADKPVYLDLEPPVWKAIAKAVGAPPDRACDEMSALVRDTLDLSTTTAVFRGWRRRLANWRQVDLLEPPPHLPLLALLATAAEQMGAHSDFAPHNYYAPLCKLLDLTYGSAEADRLIRAYRDDSELLWGSLNAWLEAWEGVRGLPTAESVGRHRFIGLPLSQAIIRAADRAALVRMFDELDLAPGATTSPQEMEILLEEWIQTGSGVTSTLRRIWGAGGSFHRQLAEVAAGELSAWTGRSTQTEGGVSRAKLTASLRTFPRRELVLNLLIPSFDVDEPWISLTADGPIIPTAAVPGRGVTVADPSALSAAEALSRPLTVAAASGATAQRLPRRLVVFLREPLTGAHVEATHIALGADAMILSVRGLKPQLDEALQRVARPGWRCYDEVPGLPQDWVLYSDVQIVEVLEDGGPADLNALVPLTATQLVVTGGLRIPGSTARWVATAPPEVRAVDSSAASLTLRIKDMATDEVIADHTQDGSVAVWPLDFFELPPGDYRVLLHPDGQKVPTHRAAVKLRSADNPAAEEHPVLGYRIGGESLGDISAGEDGVVRGGQVPPFEPAPPPAVQVPTRLHREPRSSRFEPSRITVSTQTAECFVTGAHRLVLPVGWPGARIRHAVVGRCVHCGLEKRIPPVRRKRRSSKRRWDGIVDVASLKPVSVADAVNWDAGLDAICHLGGGNAGSLERIGMQLDASALFVDHLIRGLEALGHIDVERDEQLRPSRWSVAPTTLCTLPHLGRTVVTGFRNERLIYELHRAAHAVGTEVDWEDRGDCPASIFVRTADLSALEDISHRVGSAVPGGVGISVNPALALAGGVRPLYHVARELPRVPATGMHDVRRWDVRSASWVRTADASAAGFYQLKDRQTRYAFRSSSDVASGTMRLADARLIKHLAAWAHRTSHMAYDGSSIIVPLGADLPGLYGRAAVLASGSLPQVDERNRLLVYPNVPRPVAELLYARLTAWPDASVSQAAAV